MEKQKKLLFLFLLITFNAFSQKEANNWYFGAKAGITFNTAPPSALLDGQLNTFEGCSSISDSEGNLLFYTNGSMVFNKNHEVMLNGIGLMGNTSSTQSGVIVPKPGSTIIYYIFTVPAYYNDFDSLRFSTIDMSLDGGLGGVVVSEKNILLHTDAMEKLTAIYNHQTQEYWVVSPQLNSNKVLAYKIDNSGVSTIAVSSNISLNMYNFDHSSGYMKFSPNGKKLAMALGYDEGVYVFDFDIDTGGVSNEYILPAEGGDPYGIEFSPNNNLLYVSYGDLYNHIDQYNISLPTQAEVQASKYQLEMPSAVEYNYCAMQLGPDSKIYVSPFNENYLSIIHNPNIIGVGCYIEPNGIFLENKFTKLGLPAFIQSFFEAPEFEFENLCLGDVTAFYYEFDLATDIEWDFGDPSSSTNTSNELNPTHIYISTGDYEVTLTFKINGEEFEKTQIITIYEVPEIPEIPEINAFIVCENENTALGSFDTSNLEALLLNGQTNVEIRYFDENDNELASPLPNPFDSHTQDITAVLKNALHEECSEEVMISFIVNENPELEEEVLNIKSCLFSGENFEIDLLEYLNQNTVTGYEISFYLNEQDALNNENAIENTQQFTETTEIFVRIEDLETGCFNIEFLEVEIFEKPNNIEIEEVKICNEDNDGLVVLDLNILKSFVLEEDLLEDYNITFHLSENDAFENLSALDSLFSMTESLHVLFIRVENPLLEGCFLVFNFTVLQVEIPEINLEEEYIFCNSDTLILEIPEFDGRVEWSTGEITNSIEISEAGTYSVALTNDVTFGESCETTHEFEVYQSTAAIIEEIKIQDWTSQENVIEILVSGLGDYEYSLDGENYQDSNEFTDLTFGEYIIYVRDKNGCGVVSEEVTLMFYPKYFTPNGDGIHDYWQVHGNENLKNAKLYIFDRYGKLIEKIYPRGKGWDGTKNGIELPSTDYWFLLEKDGKEYRGHFTLKR
ncbi:T9SS type B sorting domain-containing protein [Aureivirga sp. CE67]|uniref:T9SS type B sorting domain-containing protein n=1 Tax=Aureivirga sp. CE67 TaxID=1788983 RepID=UPI0018CB40EE|nr:T9SS type B sorting domain-containing protein [Aureivirga sp. CE67]